MKHLTTLLPILLLLSACIPDNIKEKMNEGMASAQQTLGDWEFKKAIAHIELHKLRSGNYPNSLNDLKFVSPMDSSMFQNVEYIKLDTAYELNLKMKMVSFDGKQSEPINLRYPAEFWTGLGCIRSNVK